MTLTLRKVDAIIDQCQLFLSKDLVTVREVVELIGKQSYSITGPYKGNQFWNFQCRKTSREDFVYLTP